MKNAYVGYSNLVNHVSIEDALRKTNRTKRLVALALIVVPLVIGVLSAIATRKLEVMALCVGVSIVFLIGFAVYAISRKLDTEWEGTVVDKKISMRMRRKANDRRRAEPIYIIKVERDDGKVTKIKESAVYHPYYDYLEIGEKIKHYPQFAHYYEKYDKTNVEYVFCPACQTKNSIHEDHCSRCGAVILK